MKRYMISVFLLLSVCGMAFAQASYDIKEMTPAVTAALEARKARFAELKALKMQGVVGENNRGYVEALGPDASAASLVSAENKDRKAVYLAIVEQNGLGAGALNTVENVFAGVQRNKASAGEKVQDEAGNWMTK